MPTLIKLLSRLVQLMTIASLVAVLPLALQVPPAWAAVDKIYFTTNDCHYGVGTSCDVRNINPDGSSPALVMADMTGTPTDIAIDQTHGKIYYTDGDNWNIWWMGMDGSNNQVLIPGLNSVTNYNGIALDVAGGRIYYTVHDVSTIPCDCSIKSAALDGSDVKTVYTSPTGSPGDIALDLKHGKIYFTEIDNMNIWWLNLDGTGAAPLIPGQMNVNSYNNIVLDVEGGKVYYTASNTSLIPAEISVRRANLDGTGDVQLYNDPMATLTSLTLDISAGKIYVIDQSNATILRMNMLDGSAVETFLANVQANGIATNPAVPTAISLQRLSARRSPPAWLPALAVCLALFLLLALLKRRAIILKR